MLEQLLAPAFRAWHRSSGARFSTVPRPMDSPEVSVPGDDPCRVLLIGSGPAVGWGVITHQLALPGHLARELSQTNGRGVELSVIADQNMTIRSALRAAKSLRTEFEVVVATIGVNDALRLISIPTWRRGVESFLDQTTTTFKARRVVLTGIVPISSIPRMTGPMASVAAVHATRMNKVTAQVCAQHEASRYMVLPLLKRVRPGSRHRSAPDYNVWAKAFTTAICDD